ncbi:hypothetical protein [Undibacterium sp. TJN19]|uniref:hypothetical protein n=1 Tax=Undibacterium sp. TJN19 TaxID=3413055 RepID=UPI003BF27178
MQLKSYLHIVRASAWYDLIVTIGFATPWSFAMVHQSLLQLNTSLGIAGEFPAFAPAHVLMANLLGSIVTIWAILRLRDTRLLYGRYDAAGRFLFSAWQIYAVVHGASQIILAFTVFELAFGIVQLLPVDEGTSKTA